MDTTVSLTDLNFALLAFGCRAIRCQSLRVGLGGQDRASRLWLPKALRCSSPRIMVRSKVTLAGPHEGDR